MNDEKMKKKVVFWGVGHEDFNSSYLQTVKFVDAEYINTYLYNVYKALVDFFFS